MFFFLFERPSDAFYEPEGIYTSFQKCVNVTGLVDTCKKVVELPEVDMSFPVPAKGIIPVVVLRYSAKPGIDKLFTYRAFNRPITAVSLPP